MFKILMDEELKIKNENLTTKNNSLYSRIKELENNLVEKESKEVQNLRNKMKKALIESDIECEKLKSKLEVYEKFVVNFNFNKEG